MVRVLDPNNNVLTTFVQSAQKAAPGQAKEAIARMVVLETASVGEGAVTTTSEVGKVLFSGPLQGPHHFCRWSCFCKDSN